MQNLSRSIRGLCCRANPAPPRWWPPGLVRRDAPLLDLLRRSCNNRPIPLAYTTTKCMDAEKMETKCTDTEKIETKCMDVEKMKTTEKVENSWYLEDPGYPKSSHRDGAIYRNWLLKKNWEEVDIFNRNETLLEPMMFSEPTENCSYYFERCSLHSPTDMLQFMSLTLVHAPVSGSMQIYGYVAVRDERDWMLNYVFNHSRDDPIVVQQGSIIEMTGPKRGIEMDPPILIEYDLRIKNGGLEEDDMELIDGAMDCYLRTPGEPVKYRIYGNYYGTVDMSLAFVEYGVEATIEVVISDAERVAHRGLNLSLGSLVDIAGEYEEIQLFQGTIDQLSVRRFVVAVSFNTEMILKLKVDDNGAERCLSFKAKQHGSDRQSMKFELCPIVVKVTWSSIHDG